MLECRPVECKMSQVTLGLISSVASVQLGWCTNGAMFCADKKNPSSQQVAVFSRTWPAARRAGQHMPHKAGIDGYFISVGERQPAQQVCIAKNSFPVSRASLRTFLRKLI
jgi:hypothetical protein